MRIGEQVYLDKKALAEAGGDLGRAEEILRIKLGKKAGERAESRQATAGLVATSGGASVRVANPRLVERV